MRRLVHADWSVNPPGRWAAEAVRVGDRWQAGAPYNVPPLDRFLDSLIVQADGGSTLAGFDFPIGLPVAYARRTRFAGFADALAGFSIGDWTSFYDAAKTPDEIALTRPFYPARPGGTRLQHLLDGHGVATIDPLTRRCERGGPDNPAAGCMFWTLGAKQVGKAALAGWRGVVAPAIARCASVWPFDGDLASLTPSGGLILAETYPADVYGRIGAAFGPGESKRRQSDRASKAPALLAWAADRCVELTPDLAALIRDGFSPQDRGGDRFDAVVGLFGMIDVADGRYPDGAPRDDDDVKRWEGWILGRKA